MKFVRLILICVLPTLAFSQTFQGNLAGIVTDSSNAAVAGASVDLESPANGLKRNTPTESNGSFLFAELPVGAYTLTVTRAGFTTQKSIMWMSQFRKPPIFRFSSASLRSNRSWW